MGTANRHARWRSISLALGVGGAAGAAMTFFGCGEELPLLDIETPPDAAPAEGGTAEASADGPTPGSSCDSLDPPTAPWIVSVGDEQSQLLRCIAADEDGVILGGSFEGKMRFPNGPELTSAGSADAYVVALNNDGQWRWGHRFGDGNQQYISALSVQGDTVMAASFFLGSITLPDGRTLEATPDDSSDALLVRMSVRDGSINQHFHVAGPGQQSIIQIAQPTQGAAIAVGEVAGAFTWPFAAMPLTIQSKGSFDGFAAQVFTGETWIRQYSGTTDAGATEPSNQRVSAAAVSRGATQFVVLAGYFDGSVASDGLSFSSAGNEDLFLEKLDASGKPVGDGWPKRFGDTARQADIRVAIAENDDVVVAGSYFSRIDLGGGALESKGAADIFLARFTSDGTLQWAKSLGGDGDDSLQAMVLDPCGDILLGGSFGGTADFGGAEPLKSAGKKDGFVTKLRGDGTHVWTQRFGDGEDQFVYGVAASPRTGEVFIAGYYYGQIDFAPAGQTIKSAGGGPDIFVAKIRP